MGFAAYRVTRSVGGELTIIVPKVEKQFSVGSGKWKIDHLLEYSDFPIEAHVFVNSKHLQDAKNYGFGNIINLGDYANETWTFNNNAKIKFNSTGLGYTLYSPNGTTYYADSGSSDWYAQWFPCIVGDDEEGLMPRCYYERGTLSFSGERQYIPLSVHEINFYKGSIPIYITDDPYGDGGVSETGGGTGTFSDEGTNIEIPELPTISATDAGFITLFNPSLDEMRNLASYMWSDLFDINGWKKVFADPMNAILGLSIVPVNVPSNGTKPVKVGNISTDVSMTVASSQYVEVDCGTLNIKEFWGAYLDYDPYTKAELYLPYIGTHAIAVDDIMNKAVRIVYHVDILSGACCAYIQCNGTVLYSFVGQCSSSIPITGNDWTSVINGALSIAGSIGSMVATGGASAPMAIGQIASTAVNSMKPNVEKSGSMSGTGGIMGVQVPYLILTRPRQCLPGDQHAFTGYPSFITKKLSEIIGYTEVESIHLENVSATDDELNEIVNLLMGGVIF